MNQSVKVKSIKKRVNRFKKSLGTRYSQLPKAFQENLTTALLGDGVICPWCESPNFVGYSQEKIIESLQKHNGFFCTKCSNGGKRFAQNFGNVAPKTKVQEIMRKSGMGDLSKWQESVLFDFDPTQESWNLRTALSLVCKNGHVQTYSIHKWQTILNTSPNRKKEGNFCDICTGIGSKYTKGTVGLQRKMQKIHPHAILITKVDKRTHEWSCGKRTKSGEFEVSHPTFIIKDDKINRHKDSDNFSFCVVCAEEQGFGQPSIPKTPQMVSSRWKYRAAKVASFLGYDSITSVSVSFENSPSTSEAIDTRYTPMMFQCHNSSHPLVRGTYGNLFSKHKKGYCPACLQEAGVRSYQELEQRMKHF